MYYPASATIAGSHPELADEVSELDAYLAGLDGVPARLEIASDILGVPPDCLRRLLELYIEAGAVAAEYWYFCPECTSSVERVPEEAAADFYCDVCERTVSFRDRELIAEKVYRPELADVRPAESQEAATTAVTTILFVAGDRSGGQRSPLMIPREEKAIRDSIERSKLRGLFSFAHPIHSARPRDVINSHNDRPDVFHFAGHGEERRLILVEDRDLAPERIEVQAAQLVEFFGHFPCRVRLAYFSTCHSAAFARHMAEQGAVDVAIGFPAKIADDLAIGFAESFYRLVGDGQPVAQAFGMSLLRLAKLDEPARPLLATAPGVDAATYRLTEPRPACSVTAGCESGDQG
jgi:hypothetical protein